jgi:hypothetical protein
MCGLDPLRNRRGYGHAGQWLQGKHIGAFRPRPFGLKSSCLLKCSFSQNGPIFVKFPVIFLQLFVPDPDRFHTCRLDLRLDRAELSLACGSRCGSNGKAARQGPAARLWIQEFESSLGSQAVESPGCYFPVCENPRHSRGLGWRAPVSDRRLLACWSVRGGFRAAVSARDFPISISAGRRPVRLLTETGSRSALRVRRRRKVHSLGRLFMQ